MPVADSLAALFPPPQELRDVVERITRRGGHAWIVGGTVRDALLGRAPHDWDLAVALPGPELVATFPDAVTADPRLGAVQLTSPAGRLALTSLREEAGYRDRRHPDQVRFVARPEQDAQRRDFTVNALYVDAADGELLDPTGGVADLRACRLRMIGDAGARLAEDPLRVLRAIRFAAGCRLEFDPPLAQALPATAPLLAGLSADRAGVELTAMFTGIGRGRALRLLVETGAAAAVLPEAIRMTGVPQPVQFHPEGDVLTHVCLVLAQVPAGDPVLAWSAVLHDIGKPATFERAEDRIRFSRHDVVSADLAAQILRRLRIGRDVRERVVAICREHIRFASLPQMAPGRAERWMRDPGFAAHLEFHRADCTASHGLLDIHAWARRISAALPPLPPPPLCTGRDVLALGVPAGPIVGRVLAELDEAVAAGEIQDRDAALSRLQILVERIVKTSGQDGR